MTSLVLGGSFQFVANASAQQLAPNQTNGFGNNR
jgi:hypothetical protein